MASQLNNQLFRNLAWYLNRKHIHKLNMLHNLTSHLDAFRNFNMKTRGCNWHVDWLRVSTFVYKPLANTDKTLVSLFLHPIICIISQLSWWSEQLNSHDVLEHLYLQSPEWMIFCFIIDLCRFMLISQCKSSTYATGLARRLEPFTWCYFLSVQSVMLQSREQNMDYISLWIQKDFSNACRIWFVNIVNNN